MYYIFILKQQYENKQRYYGFLENITRSIPITIGKLDKREENKIRIY